MHHTSFRGSRTGARVPKTVCAADPRVANGEISRNPEGTCQVVPFRVVPIGCVPATAELVAAEPGRSKLGTHYDFGYRPDVRPGDSANYSYRIRNLDSPQCGTTEFRANEYEYAPYPEYAGWFNAASRPVVEVAPGALSDPIFKSVTTAEDSPVAHGFLKTAFNRVGLPGTTMASLNFDLEPRAPKKCSKRRPEIRVRETNPPGLLYIKSKTPPPEVRFVAHNLDSYEDCPPEAYSFVVRGLPPGWKYVVLSGRTQPVVPGLDSLEWRVRFDPPAAVVPASHTIEIGVSGTDYGYTGMQRIGLEIR